MLWPRPGLGPLSSGPPGPDRGARTGERAGPGVSRALLRVLGKDGSLIDGKEESYERDPGGVPFVFNKEVSRTFSKVLETCPECRNVFRHSGQGPA